MQLNSTYVQQLAAIYVYSSSGLPPNVSHSLHDFVVLLLNTDTKSKKGVHVVLPVISNLTYECCKLRPHHHFPRSLTIHDAPAPSLAYPLNTCWVDQLHMQVGRHILQNSSLHCMHVLNVTHNLMPTCLESCACGLYGAKTEKHSGLTHKT